MATAKKSTHAKPSILRNTATAKMPPSTQLRPDRFRAVAALGVPLMGRAPMPPSKLLPQTKGSVFLRAVLFRAWFGSK